MSEFELPTERDSIRGNRFRGSDRLHWDTVFLLFHWGNYHFTMRLSVGVVTQWRMIWNPTDRQSGLSKYVISMKIPSTPSVCRLYVRSSNYTQHITISHHWWHYKGTAMVTNQCTVWDSLSLLVNSLSQGHLDEHLETRASLRMNRSLTKREIGFSKSTIFRYDVGHFIVLEWYINTWIAFFWAQHAVKGLSGLGLLWE